MRYRKGIVAFALLSLIAAPARAASITVDEVLFASGVNAGALSGTVNMTLSGSTLQIVLTNTSTDNAGSGPGVLLTGLGFQLPTGVSITSGLVSMTGSSAIGFGAPSTGNVSSEWGYDYGSLHSGAFQGMAWLDYNAVVGSMESITTKQFAPGSIAQPGNLGGPDFGLVSANETDPLGNGVEAIRSSILMLLTLEAMGGTIPLDLIEQIQGGNVGLSFGSPDLTTVPEPGSLSLLGIGLASLATAMRRRKHAKTHDVVA